MQKKRNMVTRRRFFKGASAGLGFGMLTTAAGKAGAASPPTVIQSGRQNRKTIERPGNRLPREVWVATISQNGMHAKTWKGMSAQMIRRMNEVVPFKPDIICLPEVFPFVNLDSGRPPVGRIAEEAPGEVSRPFARFARDHDCYVVCPIYTKEADKCYNAALFFDRKGALAGEYRKVHPTVGEMDNGVTPGPLPPPVFKTDFGIVGAQICFDIEWTDSWRLLRQAGAEMVFWTSAFAGGNVVNTKAWQNKYVVVSSTRKDTSKICDISGVTVAQTGRWNDWVCAPVNLEKAFLHTWPFCRRFDEIKAKYGRKVRITNFAEEEWSIIESRAPEISVADVLKEFELQAYEDYIKTADTEQKRRRP